MRKASAKKTPKRKRARAPSPRKPARKAARPAKAEQIEALILLMASGTPPAALRNKAGSDPINLQPGQIDAAVEEARKRITLAADYHRHHELGRAITRLQDCYKNARAILDIRTALSCQRELNKLLRLYQAAAAAEPENIEPEAADLLRAHLLPLGLANDDDTTEEIARRAVAEIVRLRAELRRAQGAGP